MLSNTYRSHINVGTGIDCTIKDLAILIKKIVGFEGDIEFDTNKPDGVARKLVDVSRLTSMGWTYNVELEDGLKIAYEWYLKQKL